MAWQIRQGYGIFMRLSKKALTLAACVAVAASVAPATAQAAPGRYVAIGDSYAAMGSITKTPSLNPIDTSCGRSRDSYPYAVANAAGLSVTDVSCANATTDNYWRGGWFGPTWVPAQREALGPDVKLVTIQLGGNPSLGTRVMPGCLPTLIGGVPGLCGLSVHSVDYAATQAELTSIIRDVKAKAPNATVALVGYLPAVPSSGTCPSLGMMSDQDRREVRGYTESLNSSMQSAAEATGAKYVSPPDDGLGICANPGVRRVSLAGPFTADDAFPGHPTSAGHVAMTNEILATVGS